MKEVKLEQAAYDFNGKMSLRQAIPLGLQHVCAMFVGNLTPLLIITGACGMVGGEFAHLQIDLLQNAMFVTDVLCKFEESESSERSQVGTGSLRF